MSQLALSFVMGFCIAMLLMLVGFWWSDHIGNAILVVNRADVAKVCAAIGGCE